MTTAIHNLPSHSATRPSFSTTLLAFASALLCVNLRNVLATQSSAEQNDAASYACGL